MSTEQWQAELDLHRIELEARSQRTSYFEKLAILDGGTVALVVTAVLGPLHGSIRHKYTLGIGLTFLVLAMLILLRRNYQAAVLEFHAAARTSRDPVYAQNALARKQWSNIQSDIYYSETIGAVISALGIVILLIEVRLILVVSRSPTRAETCRG
jgi:hypothetical protein